MKKTLINAKAKYNEMILLSQVSNLLMKRYSRSVNTQACRHWGQEGGIVPQ